MYRAEHDFLKRPVAIKVLHPELSARPNMVGRFFQEALAVNRARHPNIIDITDVVASENSPPYIVMELLEGEDLADFIDKYAPIAVSEAVPILTQICDALAVVHELGIVHRDLKPENIFLTKSPQNPEDPPVVKLLDFGIAKFLHSQENRRRTWSGGVLGTPAYMPMEQLHGLPVDHRADIYALGVVTYEMLTGRLPFEIDSMEDLSNQRLTLEPPPPSTRPIHHPPEPITPAVDRVVLRALNDDPTRRFQTVGEFKEALLAALQAEASPAAAPGAGSREAPPDADAGPHAPEPAMAGAERDTPDPPDAAPLAAALPPLPEGAPLPEAGRPSREGRSARRWRAALVAGVLSLLFVATWWAWRRQAEPPKRSAAAVPATPRAASARTARPATAPGRDAPRPRPTAVQIVSHPPHARIHDANGAFLGQTPAAVPVPEGQLRTLELRLDGHRSARLTISAQGPNPVQVWMKPLPESRPVGRLRPKPHRLVRFPLSSRRRPPYPAAMRFPSVTDQGILDPFRHPPMRVTP